MAAPLIPIFAALLPEIVKLIPQLGSLFGSGSEVATRNIAAATAVANAVTSATNSPNLQAAVEAMQSDPEALRAAQVAVVELWPSITESGGGGIKAAREFAEAHMQGRGGRIIENVTYAALGFLLIANSLAAAVFWIKDDSSLVNTVIQADIGTALMALGFWLGTSMSSQRKDSAILGGKP